MRRSVFFANLCDMTTTTLLLISALTIFILLGCLLAVFVRSQRVAAPLREELARKEAEIQFLQRQLQEGQSDLQRMREDQESVRQILQKAQQAEQLALQQVSHIEAKQQEWEQLKQQFEQAAKAAVMVTGQELSSKLLADHKREATEVKNQFAEQQAQQQQKFMQQFNTLTESVAAIRQVSMDSQKKSEIMWRALSAPHAVGQMTEVALENLLKNLGLREGVDFRLQASVLGGEGAGLRPDCVIYLPHDRLMIIDCKASKHQLELESAEGEQERLAAQEKFRSSMHKHLEMLSRKDYSRAVADEYRQRTGRMPHHQLLNVMYIASESAVEKLDMLDSGFRDKMQKAGIIPVGPSGLQGLCSIASMQIVEAQKAENQERILHEIERLLGGFAMAFSHLQKLGKAIGTAAENFSNFTGSYNRNVSPKLRQLGKMGVKAEGKTPLPDRLPVYEVKAVEDWLTIESESEEENPPRLVSSA